MIVSGVKDNKHISVALSVNHLGHILCEQIASLDDIKVDTGVSHDGKVLIQTGDKLFLFNVSQVEKSIAFEEVQSVDLQANDKLLGLSNGVATVYSATKKIRTFQITTQDLK
jgi:hypothetical protein